MGRIQSSIGLSSGLDIAGTVDQLMAISAQPRDRLANRIKGLETTQIAINELTALVIGVQLQATRLGAASNLATTQATSNRSEVLKAVVKGTPSHGTYSIQAVQTAQTSAASSNVFASASDTLQAGQLVVRTGGFVDGSASLDSLGGGKGVAGGRIRITDRGGVASTVDLRFASTVDDVVKAINASTNLRVSAKISGDRIELTDLTGQITSNLIVEEVGEGRVAADLGLAGVNIAASSASGSDLATLASTSRLSTLRDGNGIAFQTGTDLNVSLRDGSSLAIDADGSGQPTTIGQLLSTINAIDPSKLEARIASNGKGIELIDKTAGSATFAANGKLADALGLTDAIANAGTLSGQRIVNTLSGPLLSSLQGGAGIGTPGTIAVTNRSGTTTNIDLSGTESLRDVIRVINASGAGVTASLNTSRTGLVVQDVTGSTTSNLIIADADANQTATQLKLSNNVAGNAIDSGALDLQYVNETTQLSALNQGRGVRSGVIELVNSAGVTRTISIGGLADKTVGGVIAAINATDIGLEAKINSTGDGLAITDSSTGSGDFTITDRSGGLAGRDLGIIGTGQSINENNATARRIVGSQNLRLDITDSTQLSQVVDQINSADGPLTASLLVAGNSVRLLFNSRASGNQGRIVVDGASVGIDATATVTGRDAILAISPSENSGGALVRSASNEFDNTITGLSLTIASVQSDPVEIQVSEDNSNVTKSVQLFVDQFNKVRDRLDTLASFDPATGQTGILFGSNEVLRLDQGLDRIINQSVSSTATIRSMEQLGVSLDGEGKLRLNTDKLNSALAADPEGVTQFFTKETTGFSARAKTLLEGIVGVNGGLLVNRNNTLQRQIEDRSKRVDFLNAKLDRERERLLLQFYKMEETLAKLRNNTSSLTTLQNLAAGTQA